MLPNKGLRISLNNSIEHMKKSCVSWLCCPLLTRKAGKDFGRGCVVASEGLVRFKVSRTYGREWTPLDVAPKTFSD
jgi:hypothetical protein